MMDRKWISFDRFHCEGFLLAAVYYPDAISSGNIYLTIC